MNGEDNQMNEILAAATMKKSRTETRPLTTLERIGREASRARQVARKVVSLASDLLRVAAYSAQNFFSKVYNSDGATSADKFFSDSASSAGVVFVDATCLARDASLPILSSVVNGLVSVLDFFIVAAARISFI
jgi:hypothetical protein